MSSGDKSITPQFSQNIGTLATSNELLIDAQWPPLKISEQRLVLYMLSLIQRDDKDFRTYRISLRELNNIMEGSDRKDLYARVDEATDGLLTKVIRWVDPTKNEGGLEKACWCSSASIVPGKGYVEICFDPKLKPFLLALKGNFTTWGEAKAVLRLRNHYSLRLYQFIKYNQGFAKVDGRKSVIVELAWLRHYLSIAADTYRLYGHLRSKVIMPAQKDIAAKTDVEFEFIPLKRGRKVEQIEFRWTINRRFDQLELPGFAPTGGESTLEDILTLEFGISPPAQVKELVRKFSDDHIRESLAVARDYIKKLKKKGKDVESVGGIARKAIEEGWKKTQHIDANQINATPLPAQSIEDFYHKEAQKFQEEKTQERILSFFNNLSDKQQKVILVQFRDYLVESKFRGIIDLFDEQELKAAAVKSMFSVFYKEHEYLFISEA